MATTCRVAAWLTVVIACLLTLSALPCNARAGVIVSLGDSYSSGEAVPPYDRGTDNALQHKCHRSPSAWPRMLGVTIDQHLACSGAVIRNIQGTGQTDSGPDKRDQIGRLRDLAKSRIIGRVVMTIGGNDMGFKDRLKDCYLWGTARCLNDAKQIKTELQTLRGRLSGLYKQVHEAAGAPLLVVGYPDVFPGPEEDQRCFWLNSEMQRRFARFSSSLDETIKNAARDAEVDFLSVRDVFDGHELCTKRPWIRAIVGRPGDVLGDQQQAHPLFEGQLAIAERVATWLLNNRPTCTSASSVAAVVDDSGSMRDNDPTSIRRRALELLLTKPSNQGRAFSAVEFGTDAGPLFGPALAGAAQQKMLGSLASLQNDGFSDGTGTDYNEAFRGAATNHPGAAAWIFLTDGAHNQGSYDEAHAGGPPTYVIGLNIGPANVNDANARLLARIASQTGGRYFPLRLTSGDAPGVQLTRLQPALNEIDARLECAGVQAEGNLRIAASGRGTGAISALFRRKAGIEVVISWTNPDVDVDLGSLTVRDHRARVVGDRAGRKRIAGTKRRRTRLVVSTLEGKTFDTVLIRRPAHGRALTLTITAPRGAGDLPVTVQVRPTDTVPDRSGTTEVPDASPPSNTAPIAATPPAPPTPPPTPAPEPPKPPPPPADRRAVTSWDFLNQGNYWTYAWWGWDAFVARSNTLTYASVVLGNPNLVSGAVVPYNLRLRICTAQPDDSGNCPAIADVSPQVTNYGETGRDLGDVPVTKGATYWVLFNSPPRVNNRDWDAFWASTHSGKPPGQRDSIGQTFNLNAAVRGYDR